ncbi:MAG: hypothetical protein OEV06_00840 [Anaerolineae bacterium]|nr:hypothetical protein [Anaerolineae bacterium]
MESLAFAIYTSPGEEAQQSIWLLESLRAFGGQAAEAPATIVTPCPVEEFSKQEWEVLAELGAEIIAFEMEPEVRDFPLSALPYAAAVAEEYFEGQAQAIAWLLLDTLVVNPLDSFFLPEGTSFAYRPVHHTLIGSPYNEPLDEYWSLIYHHCRVAEERVFPMETCVGDNVIRPYFNAGILVARPEEGLFTTWRDAFDKLHRHPDFQPFYERDSRYAVFMHQAVLSGVVLSLFTRDAMVELPPTFNYPLHLHHAEMPPSIRPNILNDLTTGRYENHHELLEALSSIEMKEPLKGWLEARFFSA